MDSLQGKLAVVTGGGSGMGRELVVQLAAAGCSVAACDINLDAAAETAALGNDGAAEGVRVTAHACDVSDEGAVNRFRDEVLAEHDTTHVNLLFNNAGIAGAGSFIADDRADWERVFDICWGGVYNCTRAFMPLLIASDEGCIINTSSITGGIWATHGPGAPSTSYATAKAAVKTFTEALIEDLRTNAPHVRVCLVIPGEVGTGIGKNSLQVLAGEKPAASMREWLEVFGISFEGLSEDIAKKAEMLVPEVDRGLALMTASRAAGTILDAVLEGKWRLLLGDDATKLDQIARESPESIYEPGFRGQEAPWFLPILLLSARFGVESDLALVTAIEFRSGSERIAVRVADGVLTATRGTISSPDAVVEVDPSVLLGLLTDDEDFSALEHAGQVNVRGDESAIHRLFAACGLRAGARDGESA